MADMRMAVCALPLTSGLFVADDVVHKIFMAVDTVVMQSLGVVCANLNRFVKILQRKSLGMPNAILGFG